MVFVKPIVRKFFRKKSSSAKCSGKCNGSPPKCYHQQLKLRARSRLTLVEKHLDLGMVGNLDIVSSLGGCGGSGVQGVPCLGGAHHPRLHRCLQEIFRCQRFWTGLVCLDKGHHRVLILGFYKGKSANNRCVVDGWVLLLL